MIRQPRTSPLFPYTTLSRSAHERGGPRPPVRLDERAHHVDAAPAEIVRLLQHSVRLPDSRREAHVQLQPPTPGPLDQLEEVLGLAGRSAFGHAHPSWYFRLFRHRVETSSSRIRAASSCVLVRERTRSGRWAVTATSSPRMPSRESTAYFPAILGGRPKVRSNARLTRSTFTRGSPRTNRSRPSR